MGAFESTEDEMYVYVFISVSLLLYLDFLDYLAIFAIE